MIFIIFISLITQFVSQYENFKRPEVDESSSHELGYKPSAEGLFYVMERLNLVGQTFNRLTALSIAYRKKHQYFYNCSCSCGNLHVVGGIALKSGHIKSCGCSRTGPITHGYTKHGKTAPEYHAWASMKARCYNPNKEKYKNYGGRGIKVCKRWLHSFENFLADMGNKPTPKHTLERKNPNNDYSPSNCRWATWKEQANNKNTTVRITYKGQTKSLWEWSEILGIPRGTLLGRYKRTGVDDFDKPLNFNLSKITYNGKTQSFQEWSKELGISEGALKQRYHRNGLKHFGKPLKFRIQN